MRHAARTTDCGGGLGSRVVVQVRTKPTLHFLEGHSFATMVIENLIAIDFADGKVFGIRMGKIQSAHARPRPHRKTFGQLDSGILFRVQKLPQELFLRVVRARRITGRRTNTAIFFLDEIFVSESFVLSKTPLVTHLLVKILGEGFSQAISKGPQ